MMFQLRLYMGPCLLEAVPRRILLPLFFTIRALTLSPRMEKHGRPTHKMKPAMQAAILNSFLRSFIIHPNPLWWHLPCTSAVWRRANAIGLGCSQGSLPLSVFGQA